MNKIVFKKSITEIFNCEDGHKVILCKNNPETNKKDYMCLVCDNIISINSKDIKDNNTIYTDMNDYEFINSISKIKYEFLSEYYENNQSISDAVNSVNEKVKIK